MPDLLVTRKVYTPKSVIGELSMRGAFFCWTLEPPTREWRPEFPAIPAGRYPASIYRSARLARDVILLADVPNRKYIEMHPGNYPHETEGCFLVGHEKGVDYIGSSRVAFDRLMMEVKTWAAINVVVLDTMYEEDQKGQGELL